jgi:hypothetical protein
MQLCEICKEPAAHSLTLGRDGQTVTSWYCYVHAAEPGLLEIPLDLLQRAAAETGYPVNALIFVLESLIRAGCMTERETAEEMAWAIDPTRTPLDVCVCLSRAAVERFRQQAGLALSYWKLRRGSDLGVVLSWLARSGALTISEDAKERLLAGLSTMDGPLIVEEIRGGEARDGHGKGNERQGG